MKDLLVIGGGIAGLATMHETGLRRPEWDILLVEGEGRLGGNIRTSHEAGFTIEWGVNGFLNSVPETLEIVREAGFEDELLPSNASAARRFIFRGGRLREIPLRPLDFLRSDVLTLRGRLRVLGEPFAHRRSDPDESVYKFAARRIGREAADILVDPMVSGVYAGDSRALSLRSTFPKMHEMEAGHGSLMRALMARRRLARQAGAARGGPGGPAGTLTSFRGGMESLVLRLAERIGPHRILTGCRVTGVRRSDGGYEVAIEGGKIERARRIAVATPARHAAAFLSTLDETLAGDLAGIGYAGLAVVALAYRVDDLGRAPDGFGFLVPRGQGLRILGCLWDSSVFSNRAPEGWTLIRAMIGGAQDAEAAGLEDGRLIETVCADLVKSMGIQARPRWTRIYRHPLGIPQYVVGHAARLDRIDERLRSTPGLHLLGNSYRGVAVNNCVKEAKSLVRSGTF